MPFLGILRSGRTNAGVAEYENRLLKPDFGKRHIAASAPAWKGEDIRGKKLLVYQEQGLGDTIQFARYLEPIARIGAIVTLVVSGKVLLPLLQANFRDVDVTDASGPAGNFDRQVSLMSLPFLFGTRLDTIPKTVPYLSPERERVEKWRLRLAGGGLKVGLYWQGNRNYTRDHLRSIPLSAFLPLSSVPEVRLISLQAGDGVDQLDHLPAGMKVETLGPDIASPTKGFAEVAAVMANLDLVVTIGSSLAQLAGALAVPVLDRNCGGVGVAVAARSRGLAVVSDHAALPPSEARRLVGCGCPDDRGAAKPEGQRRVTIARRAIAKMASSLRRRSVSLCGARPPSAAQRIGWFSSCRQLPFTILPLPLPCGAT